MKQLFTFILSLLLYFPTIAQNDWFIPFGQSQEQVKHYLAGKDYLIQVREDAGMHRLLASIEAEKQIEYVFDKGTLYATSVSRKYPNKKVAKDILKSCLNYMSLISSDKIEQTNVGNATCYTAVTKARVIKLFVITHPQKTQTLQLTSFSRLHGPMKDSQMHYELNLLSNPVAKVSTSSRKDHTAKKK